MKLMHFVTFVARLTFVAAVCDFLGSHLSLPTDFLGGAPYASPSHPDAEAQ